MVDDQGWCFSIPNHSIKCRCEKILPRDASHRTVVLMPLLTLFTMATLTRSRRKYATASMLEQLPLELLTRVLEFSDLPERLQLSRCSKMLLKTITKDCKSLWIEIDFRSVRGHEHLTDEMLEALLIRVNARDVTKRLCLYQCSSIRNGRGLTPLRHSRVLEQVGLDTGCPIPNIREMEREVLRILRTVIPHKLFQVSFEPFSDIRERDGDRAFYNAGFAAWYGGRGLLSQREDFLFKMRKERFRQDSQQQLVCESCRDPVWNEEQSVTAIEEEIFPSHRCTRCHGRYCRKENCSVTLSDCCMCDDASCKDCDVAGHCGECDKTFCRPCRVTLPCRDCKQSYCTECRTVDICDSQDCETTLCDECHQLPCEKCLNWYCDDCQPPLRHCEVCDEGFCSECSEDYDCSRCTRFRCEDCSPLPISCNQCGGRVCEECRQNPCTTCDMWYCKECQPVERNCGKCGDFICSECCKECFCGRCEAVFCDACNSCIPCNRCNDRVCPNCWVACKSCSKPMCNRCYVDIRHCSDCDWPVCAECVENGENARICMNCQELVCSHCYTGSCDSCKVTLCKTCTEEMSVPLSRPPLYCMVCGKYSDKTCYCYRCKNEIMKQSKVVPSAKHGICSSCIDKRPAKKLKRASGV